ncbi:hypothetical protein ACFYO1_15575 [Nocardia sp. NPDC006044]|uniref:hypothetical protein n=1 Tax=Nocardia sp. NPDC006044 TaxID=3364306 RepID=UPI003675A364
MRIERTLAAVMVSGALVLPAAPAVAAPPVVAAAPESGSATYAREFAYFIVCLIKGQFVGSKFPLC